MSDELNVKISEIKAKFIKNEAKLVDKYFGNNDGAINKAEGAKLAQVLSGELDSKKNQKKLAKESDEVKAIFGLSVSAPAEQTQAAPVVQQEAAAAQKTVETKEVKSFVKPAAATPFDEVKARFLEILEYDEEKNTSNGTTTKEAYKQVAKEFKGKEYKEAVKQLKDYAKHDFVNMRAQKTRAAVQAYDSEGHIINEDNLQYDTSKKVYAREKELTKENNNGVKDKWAQRAIRNKNTSFVKKAARYVSGNPSAGKIDDKAVAAGNRAADIRENKTFTKTDIEKALGKDHPLLQEYKDKNGKTYENVLVATGLITADKNGNYSVKELSKVVGEAIGSDNTLNDHDNHNEAEVQSVLNRLYQSMRANGSKDFQTSTLTDKQVRKLVAFLGYEDDRTQLMAVRIWQNMWKGAGAGAASGAAAGLANGSWKVNIEQHQEVNLSMNGFTAEQKANFLNSLKAENALNDVAVTADMGNGMVNTTIGNIAETAAGIYIAQDQMVSGTVVSLIKSIAIGALTGAGVGAALGVLQTLGSHAREKEVLGMVFDCDTTFEEILDTIDNAYSDKHLSPQMKEALKKVAELGIVKEKDPKTGAMKAVLDENGNVKWDYCQFMEEYNKARGNQIFNAAELRAATRTQTSEPKVKQQTEVPPVIEDDGCPDGNCDPTVGDKAYKIAPHPWNREGGESWEAIVKAKYPCLVEELAKKGIGIYDKNGAIKVMQRALATDEDGNFHADQFRKIISGDIPKHIDFPDEINITIDGKTVICKFEDNKVQKKSQAELNANGSSKRNNGSFGYGRKGNLKTYTNSCYPAIVGEGKTEAEAKADFDRKVAAAKAKTQN